MKKICFFSGDIQRTGGTERVATLVANALADKGYEVTILSVQNGNYSSFYLHKNVRLFSLHMEGSSANFSNLKIINKLRNFFNNFQIDYVIDVDIVQSFYSIPASFFIKTKFLFIFFKITTMQLKK